MSSSGESPVSFLLSTNRAPAPIEIASIRADIDGLLREKDQLEAKLKDLNAELQSRHTILSPLRRFPAELLGEIFTTMMPSVLDENGRRQLVDLQLVCRGWRDASRLVNRLWSGVEVLPLHTAESYGKIVTWLSRSGTVPKSLNWMPWYAARDHPLSLRCSSTRGRHNKPAEECSLVNSAVVRLLTEGPKIDTLRLRCEHTDCFRYLVRAVQAYKGDSSQRPWHSLKELTIVFEKAWPDWVDPLQQTDGVLLHLIPPVAALHIQFPHDLDVFHGFLTNVQVGSELAKSTAIDIPSNILEGLTTLTFTCDWPGDRLLKILRHCKHLTTLTIDLNSPSFHPGFDHDDSTTAEQLRPSPVLLPSIHTLCYRMSEDLSILKYLNTPNLANLDITMLGVENDEPLEPSGFSRPILELAKQSGVLNSLQYLRLSYFHPSTEDLILILTSFTSVAHLVLDRLTLAWYDLWSDLADLADRDQECLPALERLEILQVPPSYPCDMFLYCFSKRNAKQQCHLALSYGDFNEKQWDESTLEKAIKGDGVNMKAHILPPVNHFVEDDPEVDIGT